MVETADEWALIRQLHPEGGALRIVRSALQRRLRRIAGQPPEYYDDDALLSRALREAVSAGSEVGRWARELHSLVRYMNPSDWVLATAVDLAIASQSDYLYFTHCGSFFTTFIEQERDMDENGVYQPGHHQNPPECLEVVVPEQ